ncbi:MAG: hypothetical protein ABIT96_09625 [Ferruginibacter sp.]
MKKFIIPLIFLACGGFYQCSSTKKSAAVAAKMDVSTISYEKDIKGIISDKCTPCHFPDKGGNKPPLNSYELVVAQANDIVRRIEMHPGDRGFMPFKRERLSDSLISVIKTWVAEGKVEK